MGSDQVRQASKALGPLLRRRGTSPALGSALRRALQALDKAFAGLSPQAAAETVEAGIAELRTCVGLIEASDRPADHEQLDGIKRALALVAPAEPAIPAAVSAPILATPGPAATPTPVTPRGEREATRRARTEPPGAAFATVGNLLLGLEARLQTLHVVLSEPLFTLAEGYVAEAELERQVEAVRWLGKARVPDILRVADLANGLEDRLVAGAALVYLGEGSGAQMMVGILARAAAAKQALPESSPTLLRTLTDAGVLDWLREIALRPTHPAVCGMLVPLLVERERLSPEELWSWVNHAKDEVAVEAACALPWLDGRFDVEALVGWARVARTSRRAHALLYAATALGSTAALAEVRARLQHEGPAHRLLVEALALAGGPGDAELLVELAAHPEGDPGFLLLAAAGLGSPATLAALPGFADDVPASLLDEAHRMISGVRSPEPGASAALDHGVRGLRGRPWSVDGLLACLGSLDEPLQAQRRLALELRVRTGQPLPSPLPLLLPPAARAERLGAWANHYAKANGKLRPGGWYVEGRPA